MRISDWSSDVCSSDLGSRPPGAGRREPGPGRRSPADWPRRPGRDHRPGCAGRPTGSHFFQLLHRQVADGAFRRGGELTNPLYYRVLRKCTNSTSRGSTDVFVTNHVTAGARRSARSEEHTSELQSLMRISYAVFCLKKKTQL